MLTEKLPITHGSGSLRRTVRGHAREGRSVTRVMATREVARAVGLMTDEQRARLGCLLMELDSAEGRIARAARAHARAQVELAAAQTV